MEATVNRFMELGDLPFPPGYVRPQQPPTPSEEPKKQEVIGKRSVNLLKSTTLMQRTRRESITTVYCTKGDKK